MIGLVVWISFALANQVSPWVFFFLEYWGRSILFHQRLLSYHDVNLERPENHLWTFGKSLPKNAAYAEGFYAKRHRQVADDTS